MKDVTSTRKAFELLLSEDYYWARTGLTKDMRRYYRSILKTGNKPITLDKMQELLQLAGFEIKTEIVWSVPQGDKS